MEKLTDKEIELLKLSWEMSSFNIHLETILNKADNHSEYIYKSGLNLVKKCEEYLDICRNELYDLRIHDLKLGIHPNTWEKYINKFKTYYPSLFKDEKNNDNQELKNQEQNE